MLDFIWTLPFQLWGTQNKWTLHKNLVHGRIRTTNTARPPDYKSDYKWSEPLGHNSLDMRRNWMSMKLIPKRSMNKRANLSTYIGSTWCTCVLRLQPYREITSVLFCRLINEDISLLFLTIFIYYKRNSRQPTHCWCDIHAPARCSLIVIWHLYCFADWSM